MTAIPAAWFVGSRCWDRSPAWLMFPHFVLCVEILAWAALGVSVLVPLVLCAVGLVGAFVWLVLDER